MKREEKKRVIGQLSSQGRKVKESKSQRVIHSLAQRSQTHTHAHTHTHTHTTKPSTISATMWLLPLRRTSNQLHLDLTYCYFNTPTRLWKGERGPHRGGPWSKTNPNFLTPRQLNGPALSSYSTPLFVGSLSRHRCHSFLFVLSFSCFKRAGHG